MNTASRRHPRRFLGAAAALLAAFVGAGVANAGASAESPMPERTDRHRADNSSQPKKLLMHYMPWYVTEPVRGEWGGHWTGWEKQHDPEQAGAKGLPDIWSHYHPLIGVYDSTEEHVIECHLLQMKLAGIDGVIADWYGITDLYDYDENHQGTEVLFEVAGRLGMEFAACFEDRTIESLVREQRIEPQGIAQHLTQTFEWMQENWFTHDHYTHVDGRPLLLNFGPIYVKDADTWQQALGAVSPRPKFFALHHLWKSIDADGGFTWVHKDVWSGTPSDDTIRERLHAAYTHTTDDPDQMIVSAKPGFHDIYANSYGYLAHRGGETLQESLEFCMNGPWDIVQLVTWNDYGEGTIIEPTHEFGYRFLEIIQDARRAEQGDRFTFTPEDLRLPARLLEHRRAAEADRPTLDRIAQALSEGRCDDARTLLDQLDG